MTSVIENSEEKQNCGAVSVIEIKQINKKAVRCCGLKSRERRAERQRDRPRRETAK